MKYIKKSYKTLYDAVKDLEYTKKDLEKCGEALRTSVQERFNKFNNEIVGAPLKPKTIARKLSSSKHLKLFNKGNLRDNLRYFISNGNIRIGYKPGFYSKLAKIHNEGTNKIPKRPFMFLNERNLKIIRFYLIPKVK